jgi:hypothetical protein
MAIELWVMPVPATSLLSEPVFTPLMKRQCEISFDIEDEGGEPSKVRLLFEGVEAYRCTYLTSCSAEMFGTAYGKLVELGPTPWLAELSRDYERYSQSVRRAPQKLQHLMICFDDGPCYEIICTGFNAG